MPPEANPLLDAVRAAITEEPTAGVTNDAEVSADPFEADAGGDAGDVGGAGDTGAADAAAGDAGTPAGESEADAPVARKRDAQGRFLAADGTVDADQAPKVGEEPVAEIDPATGLPKVAAPAKPADPINDPIPKDLKPKTAERMTALVSTAKELTTRVEQAEGDRDVLVQQIESTGCTPDQYVETLNVLRDINSDTLQGKERALEYLTKVVATLGQQLGRPAPGTDPLSGHQDLIAEVTQGVLTRARAEEIALTRGRQTAAQQFQQREQQTTQTAQSQQQAIHTGKQALVTLESQLKTADPAKYTARRAQAVAIARPLLSKMPPGEWAGAFKAIYDQLPAAPKTPAALRPTQQPIRGKPGAGGVRAAPTSHDQAVRQAIGLD